jgi:hypothetical protein
LPVLIDLRNGLTDPHFYPLIIFIISGA